MRVGSKGFEVDVYRLALGAWLFLAPLPALAADADGDGIGNKDDACRDEPETVNGYRDGDGCPDQLGTLLVTVQDLDGNLLAGVDLTLTARIGRTDGQGVATFADLTPGNAYRLTARLDGFQTRQISDITVPEGDAEQVVTLDWEPAPVRVRATDEITGNPLDVVVRVDGPGLVEPTRTGDDGDAIVMLRPGEWTLQVYADNYQPESVDLSIASNQEIPPKVFVLRPSWMAWPEVVLAFPPGVTGILPEHTEEVDAVAHTLFAFGDIDLQVTGHPDPRPETLDVSRANAVRGAILAAGVSSRRVGTELRGRSDPPADPQSATGRALGRTARVVFAAPEGVEGPTEADLLRLSGGWIRFAPGTADLGPEAVGQVGEAARLLLEHAEWTATVVGRWDDSDHPEAQARAEAVATSIAERGGPHERVAKRTAPPDPDLPGRVTFARLEEEQPTTLPHRLYFAEGDTLLLPESWLVLADLAGTLRRWPKLRLLVVGHSEPFEAGGVEAGLSEARAEAVRAALLRAGVAGDRVLATGYGPRFPARVPQGVDAPDLHRRATLVVLPEVVPVDVVVSFEPGKGQPDDAGRAALERLASALSEHPDVRVRVQARAATTESRDPRALALERASHVVAALDALGCSPGRMEPVGTVGGEAPGDVTFSVAGISLSRSVRFEAGSATLPARAAATLRAPISTQLAVPGWRLEVLGYASAEEGVDDPEALAWERARAVGALLMLHGVRETHLDLRGVATAPGVEDAQAVTVTLRAPDTEEHGLP